MIVMDDLMVSVHGESAVIGVAYDCEFEPKPAIICPVGGKNASRAQKLYRNHGIANNPMLHTLISKNNFGSFSMIR